MFLVQFIFSPFWSNGWCMTCAAFHSVHGVPPRSRRSTKSLHLCRLCSNKEHLKQKKRTSFFSFSSPFPSFSPSLPSSFPSFWHDFVPHFPYASSCASWVGGGAGWRNADSLTLFSFRPHHSFFVLSNNASLTKQIEKIPSCGCCSMPCVARHLSQSHHLQIIIS